MTYTTIRSSGRRGQAEEWALVLAAAGIAHGLAPSAQGWALSVADEDVARAAVLLAEWDAEEARPRAPAPAAAEAEPEPSSFLGVLVAMLMVAGFAVTGTPAGGSSAFERGAAVAGLMRAEPWRAVTALTLHLDVAHIAGNAAATAVLLPAIAQRLGGGPALLLTLLAGTAGNLLAAAAHAPRHAAVGASTATFAAIAILGALRLVPQDGARSRWKSWTVPAACLLLLTLLGAGRGADVVAHVTGFLSGAVVGLLAATLRRPPGPAVRWAAALLATAIVALAWLRALT